MPNTIAFTLLVLEKIVWINKTDHHDITEIVLKLALYTITLYYHPSHYCDFSIAVYGNFQNPRPVAHTPDIRSLFVLD